MIEFTAEEVRAEEQVVLAYASINPGEESEWKRNAEMLRAYADSIERAEMGVPDEVVTIAVDALEEWALQGYTLSGDDVPRFRTLADRIAPELASADAEDAARYRWLRDEAHPDSDDGFAVLRQEYSDWGKPCPAHITGSAPDDLVDAARAAKGGE